MAVDPGVQAEALFALSKFFINDYTLGQTLTRVAELSCEVGPADMAGITMLVEGRPRTGVFTDPDAVEIDEAQYESGEGPCLDAFRNQQVYRIGSTTVEERWPAFSQRAAAHGVLSTLSLPLVAQDEGLGALNLYSRNASAFDDDCVKTMKVFAVHASIALANSQVYWDARELNENLHQAMQSRSAIDQAIGVLMASGARSSEEAFMYLTRASQRENRKLRDIASEVVQRTAQRHAIEGEN